MKKAKIKKNRMTLIMLREADQPVRRSRFSRTSLYTILCMIVSVICAVVVWQYVLHQQSFHTIGTLSEEIDAHDQVFNEMVDAKEEVIEGLKLDIVHIMEQTDALKARYEDLEVLKEEVFDLLGEVEENGTHAAISKAPTIAVSSHSESAVGGEELPPTTEQWERYIEDSFAAVATLAEHMDAVTEQLDAAKAGLEDLLVELQTTPNAWPTTSRIVSSRYGVRSDPFTGSPAFHNGIDIAGNMHDPIYAAANGTVVEVGRNQLRGNYIVVQHRSNLKTSYMHLSSIDVSLHDVVTKGEHIGKLGNSGRSTGPHLHFEIIVSGEQVNPFHYLK